jgi:hypothetical protein
MYQTIKNLALVTIPSLVFCILVAELIFRFVVPASTSPVTVFDTKTDMLLYDPNAAEEGLYTRGVFADLRSKWRVNNHGWTSPIDYSVGNVLESPLAAVIGDSYVEALMVPPDSSLGARLDRMLGDRAQAYAFGISGAPLSQYLHISRYVASVFNPEVMIFVVVHNDFTESLQQEQPFFMSLQEQQGQFVEIPPVPYVPSGFRRLMGHSALVRYLWSNVGIHNIMHTLGAGSRGIPPDSLRYAANVDIAVSNRLKTRTEHAVQYLLQTIRNENPDRLILFVMDAVRRDIYRGKTPNPWLSWMATTLERESVVVGAHYIDLTSVFQAHYREHGQHFEWQNDNHWNSLGHSVVADTVFGLLRARGFGR